MNAKRCERCGAEIKENMRCCPICGYAVSQENHVVENNVSTSKIKDRNYNVWSIIGIVGKSFLVGFALFKLVTRLSETSYENNVVAVVQDTTQALSTDNSVEVYNSSSEGVVPVNQDTDSVEQNVDGYITLYCGVMAPMSDFMFAHSSDDYLSAADLEQLYDADPVVRKHRAQFAINEIFARYGYVFTSNSETAEEARKSFGNKDWYVEAQKHCPEKEQDSLRENYFNKYEKANILTLLDWEEKNIPAELV